MKQRKEEASAGKTGEEKRAENANTWARRAAVVVLIIGAALVLAPAAAHLDRVWQDPFEPSEDVTTVVKEDPSGGKTVTTTTGEANQSFVERSLAVGGLLLLRIGVVALAAFLAGAVVQRTLMADFALKLGPLELPALKRAAAASEQALAAIEDELAKQTEATERAMEVAADAAEGVASIGAAIEPLLALTAENGEKQSDVKKD